MNNGKDGYTEALHELNEILGNDSNRDYYPVASGSETSEGINFDSLKAANSKLWAVSGDAYLPCEEATPTIPAGHYVVDYSQERGVFLRKHNFSIDDLVDLPDSSSEKVIKHIEKFWTLESHFRKYGFLWKRGILLWGPAGSGKSSTLQTVAKNVIKQNGVALSVEDPRMSSVGLHLLRKIEPKRPLVCMVEDIDAIVDRYGESALLALLDGEQQIDNVVYIATTNYPEKLDARLVNRPSRFDVVEKIGMPTDAARSVFLGYKSKILTEDTQKLNKWVKDTDGFSIAHLKELIISVEVFEVDYEKALVRLRTMMECRSTSSDFRNNEIGFGAIKDIKS